MSGQPLAEEATKLMHWLEMPPIVMWAFAFTDGPIDARHPETPIYLATADPSERRAPRIPTKLLRGGDGYALEAFGMLLDPQLSDVGWPDWIFDFEDSTSRIVLEPWLTRARKPGAPGVAQCVWRPGEDQRLSIEFGNDEWSDANLVAANKALRWLRDLELVHQGRGRGRQKHYTEANEPEFFEALHKAAHAAMRAGEEHLSPASLARYGIGDRRTIGTALNFYGYDLAKIEAEAIRCTRGGANICTFRVQRRAKFKKNGG